MVGCRSGWIWRKKKNSQIPRLKNDKESDPFLRRIRTSEVYENGWLSEANDRKNKLVGEMDENAEYHQFIDVYNNLQLYERSEREDNGKAGAREDVRRKRKRGISIGLTNTRNGPMGFGRQN